MEGSFLPLDIYENIIKFMDWNTLNQFQCLDSGFSINTLFKVPCTDMLAIEYYFQNVKLESQNFISKVGQLNQVSFNWSTKIFDLTRTGNSSNMNIKASNGSIYYIYDHSANISGYDTNGDFYFSSQDFYNRAIKENFYTNIQ